jgi:transcriptional regulator
MGILIQLLRMYNPSPFAEDRIEVLHAFIRQYPLAAIVSSGLDGPEATHVPVVLHENIGANGALRCHFARANRQWETIQSSPTILAIMQGPEHYISPDWYPSKRDHGMVVPTWNYVAVHVRGKAKLFESPDELQHHLRALTDQNEITRETPWSIDDAPKSYIDALTRAVVGIEIEISAIEGKWKISQNRPEPDRKGVVAGLDSVGSPSSIEMKRLIEERRGR